MLLPFPPPALSPAAQGAEKARKEAVEREVELSWEPRISHPSLGGNLIPVLAISQDAVVSFLSSFQFPLLCLFMANG